MKRFLILTVIILTFLLNGCNGNSTKLVSSWNQPGTDSVHLKKILVVAVVRKKEHRRMYEDAFAKQLQTEGVNATASYTLVPKLSGDKDKDKPLIVAAIKKIHADGVIVATLASVDKDERYIEMAPVQVTTYSAPYGMYGYYNYRQGIIQEPGYTIKETTIKLQTTLFQVSNEGLLWTGETDSFNPESAQEVVVENVKLINSALLKSGLLQ